MNAQLPGHLEASEDGGAVVDRKRLQAGIAEALDLLARGAPQEAIARVRPLADVAARGDVGSYVLGLIFFNADDPRTALGWFERALSLNNTNVDALVARAVVLQRLGQPAEALAAYEAILALKPDDVDTKLDIGITLQSLGRMAEALEAYDEVLRAAPDHVEALTNRGILLDRYRRSEEALACFAAVEAVRPNDGRNLANKASVLQRLGRHAEALAAYEAAARWGPQDADAEIGRGNVLLSLGRLEEAVECYDRAALDGQAHPQALFTKGMALQGLGRAEAALDAYDAALAVEPAFCEAWCNRGNVLHELGRLAEAADSYDSALRVRPGFVPALTNRATIFLRCGRYEDAIFSCNSVLENAPGHARALGIRGAALHKLGRLDEALDDLDRSSERDPSAAESWLNRGNALLDLDRLEHAVSSYEKALRVRPHYPEALSGLGVALKELGRVDEALACFDEALRCRPAYADARNNRAGALLLQGMLKAGFDDFESRWDRSDAPPKTVVSSLPGWEGGDLAGKAILVWDEQGLGDLVQFSRYLLCLADLGADVTFFCRRNMHRLLGSLPSEIRLIAEPDPARVFDWQSALMSLPRGFQTTLDTIPARIPYLRAEPERVASWADRIGSDGFRIGICWRGNTEVDRHRSIPLPCFGPLAAIAGVRLVSLRREKGPIEVEAKEHRFVIETLGDGFDAGPDSFIDSAAVMATLDLVVTVDTAIAHLAGALGRPVLVALKHMADWRWMMDRDDSPWYPTMRLFRQVRRGDWDEVLARIAAFVEPLAAARGVTRRPARTARQISVPVSIGELIDKITILEIKESLIAEPSKLDNVRRELALLRMARLEAGLSDGRLPGLEAELKGTNAHLWRLEDTLRAREAQGGFDAEFVDLARQVYKTNDRRAGLKRDINLLFHSAIVEEKSYPLVEQDKGA